ncbi:DUF2971 domain-containing protein [Aeromonas veronii]
MNILYKYTTDLDTFFTKPTLKLSVPMYLNDPFESAISEEISHYESKEDGWLIELDYWTELLTLGVISFSETSRNLLMWAHYAKNHKGMCIGFEPDVLESIPRDKYMDRSYHAYYPTKVNYDNVRVDLHELAAQKSNLYDAGIKRILTTKSDDWIYEKEHRCIVPLEWCDNAILSNEIHPSTNHAIEYLRKKNSMVEIKDNHITTNSESDRELVFSELAKFNDITFLKEVNPKKVKTVHLGYRYDKNKITKLINDLKKPTHPLHHIILFQYKLSKTRYEIEPIELYPKHNNTERA